MRSLFKRKKSNITDIIFIMVILLTSGISIVLMHVILTKFSLGIPAHTINASIIDKGTESIELLDYGMGGLMIGLAMFSIISALFIRTHPIFFVISFVSLIISIFASGIISNLSYDIFMNPLISTSSTHFPITMFIFQYLPWLMTLLGIMIIMALFLKGDDQNANI